MIGEPIIYNESRKVLSILRISEGINIWWKMCREYYLNRCEKLRVRKNDEKPAGEWLRHSFQYTKRSFKRGKMIF